MRDAREPASAGSRFSAALELIENATLLASVVHEVAVHTGDDPRELLDKLAAGDQGSVFL